MDADLNLTPQDNSKALPVLEGLNTQQSAFVYAYAMAGDGNGAAAARKAGYSKGNAGVTAYRLLQDDRVLQHIALLTRRRLGALAPRAAATLDRLMQGNGHVARAAAADVLARAGLKPPERHQISVAGGVRISIDLGGGEGEKRGG